MATASENKNEQNRLKTVKNYNSVAIDRDFSFIVEAIAAICQVAVCNIVRVDEDEIRVLVSAGARTPSLYKRAGSLSQYAIHETSLIEIYNLPEDPRFQQCIPFGEMDICFYAGYPLIDSMGHVLGSLNVYDDKPRKLTEEQRQHIQNAADMVIGMILQKREKQTAVTEVEEKNRLLKSSEERFRSFFENSQSLMCMHDMQGNFMLVNKVGADMIGYTVEEIQNSSLYDIIPPERHHQLSDYLHTIATEGFATGKMQVVRKDGTRMIWLFNNALEDNGMGEKYVIGNGVDLTERFKIEEELREAKENAETANKAKSEFIANMSHEIRTPLNGIIGFTDLMLKTTLDDTQKQYLTIINQSGSALLEIVNEILDFSKIESGKIKLNVEKVDLQELAAQSCNMVSFPVEKKQLELLLDLSNDLPQYIWVDETRLKQILVNLLSNAVKFTQQGEVKLSISIQKKIHEKEMVLRFEVEDTGIGIRSDKQKEIFEAFTQEDSSITKKFGGTGLGLTISNKLLHLGGSELQLESELGKGSRFYFDLACRIEYADMDDILLQDIKQILVVDDNDNNRRILKRMLELKKIQVDEADSGIKALLMLQEKADYDVVIMDYHMPFMDGIETIRKIREIVHTKHVEQPIVMLYSSSDDESLQTACDELGVQSRLVKPIKMQEMYRVLAHLKDKNVPSERSPKPAPNDTDYFHKLHVLVAEDNEVNLFLARTLVQQIAPNALITEASDGKEAVEKFKIHPPDIILMDIQMPNMNGMDATRQIRQIEKDFRVPIIALTAGNSRGERDQAIAAGMDDFMPKPIVKQSLAMMLRKWLVIAEKEEEQIDIKSSSHIDWDWIREYTGDDEVFRKDFINLIKKGLDESLGALQAAMEARDVGALRATGHKLKGTSLMAGLTELSKQAIAFELMPSYEDEYVETLLAATKEEVKEVKQLLK